MAIRGIRGATTVSTNSKEEIIEKTGELLKEIGERNDLSPEDIASITFSVTEDLDAEFPAVAARKLEWLYTPLFCTREIPVPGSLEKCIRVLLHVNSEKPQKEMVQIYLYEAKKLRPDLDSNDVDKYYTSDK